ncbi:MAG: putative lipid II flippase FtsW [Candidatus Omnitrophica bacterium]|nr:putative lipid II flippase FtsW [Candidatus Omnitrophota bacterium]
MANIRRSIFIIALILLFFGVVMIYSSSAIYAYEKFGNSAFFLKKHLWFLFGGFLLMLCAMSVNLDVIKKSSRTLMLGSLLLLLLVLIPGIGASVGGARRWFRMGALSLQPSEFAKFTLILYLADFLSRKGYRIKDLYSGYIPCISVVILACSMVLLQPDLGTAISIFFIGFLIIFIAGGKLKHLFMTVLPGLPVLYYLIFSVPYRRKRMLIFLNPWHDKKGAGFQIIQSFLALGSGGLFGVGLGQSKQKLFYLPESHTDFIFSIIGEELGFIGASCIIILFGAFVWQGMRAFFKEQRPFNKILIFGITNMIAFEALVNIGVSVGALPTKGLPLPFISYGGSSLVFHMVALGVMLNAMRE